MPSIPSMIPDYILAIESRETKVRSAHSICDLCVLQLVGAFQFVMRLAVESQARLISVARIQEFIEVSR